jgi:hypothetical protein
MVATEAARERLNSNLNQAQVNQKAAQEAADAAKLQNTCWYCGDREKDTASTRTFKFFGDVTRSGNRTQWKTLSLSVPRCKSCNTKHQLAKLITIPLAICTVVVPACIIGFVLILILGALMEGIRDSQIGGWFVTAAIAIAFAFVSALPRILQTAYRKAASIVPLRDTKHEFDVKSFPSVNNALRSGFKFGTRP